MKLSPGAKLGPYEILARIGAGGMGEVWKARDTRLGRIVAIKMVKEQHSERFKQEARSIAALNHPYICQLFDIGEDYLVLEYVEGKSLPSPLPEREAVRLAIQIATALEEAHKKGIIHRDLKPGNIMVTDEGSAKLLDFGLAKLYEQDASSSSSPTADFPATQAGAVLGTVAYMSPEQAQGQPADARSDIFSFGLVLYEMLSGRRAFSGDSPPLILAALLRDEPTSLQASPPLERIVRACLAKQPSARYQTMSEVRTALEQVLAEKASQTSAEPQPSIAVLPFVDMSPGKDNEWFSDGLAEEIINALAQIPGLKVIARTSAFAFRAKEQDITKIAEALRVHTILEGSVRKAGNRIRVTAQLINAADGSHIWSERYDREMTDVFAIQDEISQAIAYKLRVELAPGRTIVKRQPKSLEAYSLYLKGRYHFSKLTPEGMAKSKEYYEQAIAADPNYALAWVGLAHSYLMQGHAGYLLPNSANALCRHAATKALELDVMLPEAHSIMGSLQATEFDWKRSEWEFKRTLELNPEALDGLLDYSYYYLDPMRRLDEAIANLQKAAELDPMSGIVQYQIGRHWYFVGQNDRSIKQLQDVLDLDPNYWLAYQSLALNYLETGEQDKAIRAIETAAHITRAPIVLLYVGYVYGLSGRIREAQKVLEELKEIAQRTYVPAASFAAIYVALGEVDKGIEWLEKAFDEGHALIVHFTLPPFFDRLRSYPRYHALLRKMNLEP
jgi:serine/threonine protein kinase/Tfp pilus assembly protein PilF